MHLTSTLLTTVLSGASLTMASPLKVEAVKRDIPPRSQAKGFKLVANITDPAKAAIVFPEKPIDFFYLGSARTGATTNAAVLAPPSEYSTYFLNGTARDISASATSIALPPIVWSGEPRPSTPMGIQFTPYSDGSAIGVTMNWGTGSIGAGIGFGLRDPYAQLFYQTDLGYNTGFYVCNVTGPVYTRPQYPVFAIGPEGHPSSVVPDNCVTMKLLAQCAPEPEILDADKEALNIVNEGVDCYEDVSAIEW